MCESGICPYWGQGSHALAPTCEYCGVKVIGHGIEANDSFYCCAHCARMAGAEDVSDRASELARRTLREVAHNGAQSEVCGQVRGETTYSQGLAGVESYLAPGEVRKDGAGDVDRVLTLQADEAFAPAETLLASGVEAGLSRPRAADRHPVPIEDERVSSKLQIMKTSEVRFHALLAEYGVERWQLARV